MAFPQHPIFMRMMKRQKQPKYVDILQIPAFLCRQTDLLLAAAANW